MAAAHPEAGTHRQPCLDVVHLVEAEVWEVVLPGTDNHVTLHHSASLLHIQWSKIRNKATKRKKVRLRE